MTTKDVAHAALKGLGTRSQNDRIVVWQSVMVSRCYKLIIWSVNLFYLISKNTHVCVALVTIQGVYFLPLSRLTPGMNYVPSTAIPLMYLSRTNSGIKLYNFP